MNQSINTDSKNSKEPQQKYRLRLLKFRQVIWYGSRVMLIFAQQFTTNSATLGHTALIAFATYSEPCNEDSYVLSLFIFFLFMLCPVN